MGVSTDAIIAYGIAIPEDATLPWSDYEDEEDWWCDTQGFRPTIESPFTEEGEWKEGDLGELEKQSEARYKERQDWLAAHPMPVEVVHHCSGEYPMFVLAMPGSVQTAWRGSPVHLDTMPPKPTEETDRFFEVVLDFCKGFGIDTGNEIPGWLLFSYWG